MVQLLHTPEGVRDYYNDECAGKLALCDRVRQVFHLYGYQDIQTPVFEYFDIFNAERGTVPSRDMYKLFDRDGETLVLRPDYTPAIARCAAKYFASQTLPVRLCYLGNTYVNNVGYRGLLKETTQAGVELIGDASVEANAEVLALVIDVLRRAGLSRFMIEVGDVRFFEGILASSGILAETRAALRACIESKNHFGLEELLEENHISGQLSRILIHLPQMFGHPEQILKEARSLVHNEKADEALNRLEELYGCMQSYGMSRYLTFDLGMLGNQDYYTGIIFKGYTYGTGDCIVTGGRYDRLMGQFGKDAPSVGFGLNIDVLMQAMRSQKIALPKAAEGVLLLYAKERYSEAVALAAAYRECKTPVTLMAAGSKEGLSAFAAENHITKILSLPAGGGIRESRPGEGDDSHE